MVNSGRYDVYLLLARYTLPVGAGIVGPLLTELGLLFLIVT